MSSLLPVQYQRRVCQAGGWGTEAGAGSVWGGELQAGGRRVGGRRRNGSCGCTVYRILDGRMVEEGARKKNP
jgi:hypothetical protein